MQKFTEIRVWLRSHQLALAIYQISKNFPADERFGLTLQLRRAAFSVPTNLAEGSKSDSADDYANFINISEKSLAETQYLLIVFRDLGVLNASTEAKLQKEAAGIARQLHALKTAVRQGRITDHASTF